MVERTESERTYCLNTYNDRSCVAYNKGYIFHINLCFISYCWLASLVGCCSGNEQHRRRWKGWTLQVNESDRFERRETKVTNVSLGSELLNP